jgi:LPS export ABC transporter protein LptC
MSFSRRKLQRVCLISFASFAFFLFSSVVFNSYSRDSIFTTQSAFASSDKSENPIAQALIGSRLQLRDFHRVSVKDGKLLWEIDAKEAEYYAREGVTHVTDAKLLIYKKDGKIQIQSKSAKLYLTLQKLNKAELSGESIIDLGNGTSLLTDLALYDMQTGEVSAPGSVSVQGKGYLIKGKGLVADVNRQVVRLLADVNCKFEVNAEAPKLNFLNKSGG